MYAGAQDREREEAVFYGSGAQRHVSGALWNYLSRTSNVLLAESAKFIEQGEDEWRIAVILAHAACATQTEETLDQLVTIQRLDHLRDPLLDPCAQQLSLHKERVQTLYEALTGEAPWRQGDLAKPQAAWWQAWRKSVDRRNDVAQKGLKVTRDEASASYESCRQMVLYMQQTVDRVRGRVQSGPVEVTSTPQRLLNPPNP